MIYLTAAAVLLLTSCEQPLTADDVRELLAEEPTTTDQPADPPVEEPTDPPAADPPIEESPPDPTPEQTGNPEFPDNPEPEPDPVPAWQPNPGTLYLFYDEPGGELYHSETPTATRWASRVRAYRLTAEQYGYVFVAGSPPEES